MFRSLSENVYIYEDICNVYLLKSGKKGLLIDAGSGGVLRDLRKVDIERVEMVLLTHAHRDQCLGLQALIEHGAVIKAPHAEKPYLGKGEIKDFWQKFFPFNHSTTYYSPLTEGYDEVDCCLVPGDVIKWEGISLEAVDAQGHTPGQLAYVLRHSNLLFCGDAVYDGGKVWKGYSMDWDHWTDAGVRAASQTLERIRELHLSVVAPSHGEVMDGHIDEQLTAAYECLKSYGENKSFEHFNAAVGGKPFSPSVPVQSDSTLDGEQIYQLSELLWVRENSYFLLSSTKQCLMIDCGDPFICEQLPGIMNLIGGQTVDAVIASHAHGDHVVFFNSLKERYGTKIWALDLICDVLEVPKRYWHPFSEWANTEIDRKFHDGEVVSWNEYELKFHWYPGQTAFAAAVETMVDGKHVLFSGDNFFPVEQWTGTGGIMGLNRGLPACHRYSAEKTIAISPEWILTGHQFPFLYDPQEFQYRADWAEEVLSCMERLSPQGRWQIHFNPHALSVYPFFSEVNKGECLVLWLIGEEEMLASPESDLVWDLPKGFKICKVDRPFKEPLKSNFAKLRFSGKSLWMCPIQVDVSRNADLIQHAIYVNSKQNDALEALFIVKVTS